MFDFFTLIIITTDLVMFVELSYFIFKNFNEHFFLVFLFTSVTQICLLKVFFIYVH